MHICSRTKMHMHKKARLLIKCIQTMKNSVKWGLEVYKKRKPYSCWSHSNVTFLVSPMFWLKNIFFFKKARTKTNVKIWNCSINTDSQSNFVDTAVDEKISSGARTEITSCQSTNKHSIGKIQNYVPGYHFTHSCPGTHLVVFSQMLVKFNLKCHHGGLHSKIPLADADVLACSMMIINYPLTQPGQCMAKLK